MAVESLRRAAPRAASASPSQSPVSNFFTSSARCHSQSLSPKRRLHHPWEYRRFFDQSQVLRFSDCTVFRIRNDHGHFRLGITLKARGSSVERNQVKRQIRESFRTHADVLGSFDYNVVIPGSKKMAHPYALKLGACLRKELRNAVTAR